jgi:hypothetical protein
LLRVIKSTMGFGPQREDPLMRATIPSKSRSRIQRKQTVNG